MEEFIDSRDGNHYKIIKIGSLYWFAENLKHQGILHYAPNDDTDNIDQYGCLYHWENAVEACPEGWRLPTTDDFINLAKTFHFANHLRATTWNGDNASGLSIFPAGESPATFGKDTHLWGAAGLCLWVTTKSAQIIQCMSYHAFSVRCVKEVEE